MAAGTTGTSMRGGAGNDLENYVLYALNPRDANAMHNLGWLQCQQGNYAAANAFMDALAHRIRREGRHALSINWGTWADVGLAAAEALGRSGFRVRFQTTTRSPALVRDEEGYPLRRGFEFLSPEPDAEAPRRHLYNAAWPGEDARIVLVADSPADTDRLRAPGGLLDVLTGAGHDVLAVIVPASDQAALAAARTGAAAR